MVVTGNQNQCKAQNMCLILKLIHRQYLILFNKLNNNLTSVRNRFTGYPEEKTEFLTNLIMWLF